MTVWEQSLLAAHGRHKLDEDAHLIAGIYPLQRALAGFLSTSSTMPLSTSHDEGQALVANLQALHALVGELVAIADSPQLDVSTVQRVVSWISETLAGVPEGWATITERAVKALAPMRQALSLTSGEAMESIWRAALPFRHVNEAVADAVDALCAKLATDIKQTGPAADLALEVAQSLTVPRSNEDALPAPELLRLLEQVLSRLEVDDTGDEYAEDPVAALALSSNAASLLVVELAATVAASRGDDTVSSSAPLVIKLGLHLSDSCSTATGDCLREPPRGCAEGASPLPARRYRPPPSGSRPSLRSRL